MMSFNLNGLAGFWIFGILFMLILAYIVYTDANSNGENGTMWFFIVLFLPMIGFLLYLLIRSTNRNQSRANSSYNNYSNRVASTPPVVETIRTRQSGPRYETIKKKSEKQNLSEFQFCTTCGFQNVLAASFCKSCGVKLSVGEN